MQARDGGSDEGGTRSRAAFLGRFQPFHEGHHRAVQWCQDRYPSVVLALGSPNKSRTPENPLTAPERIDVIRACHPDVDVALVPDEDRGEAGYPAWARRLVRRTNADVVVSGNDLVQRLVREHTDADVDQQEMHSPERYSGTEIRRRIRAGEPWHDLVPDCCLDTIQRYETEIRESGQ